MHQRPSRSNWPYCDSTNPDAFSGEKDSCGVGFIASVEGNRNHWVLSQALRGLSCMEHRGGCGGDGDSGDGAGILCEIPWSYLRQVWGTAKQCDPQLSGIGMIFMPKDAKNRDLVPSAVIGKLCVAIFAFFFVENFELLGNDLIYVPLMCVMCVAIPFVLVTIAPRFITGAEVNLFFLLETILGPIWVWLVIKEQPSSETILGGIVIIITIAIHSFLAIKTTQLKST